jgi:hypothetical protein
MDALLPAPILAPSTSSPPFRRNAIASEERPKRILPLEIVDDVCWRLSRQDLAPFLRVNRVFKEISDRILYHTIEKLRLPQCIICLQTLANNQRLSSYVRILEIDCHDAIPTANFYRLLHRVLKCLTGLTDLSLEVPRQHQPFWLLSDCPFSLKHFATSMPCKPALANFLNSQPSITELSLRGYQHDDYHIIPFLDPLFVHSYDRANFSLAPTALPNLVHFRTVHGRPSIISDVVAGRPIQMASIPLFPSLATDALRALGLSTRPIKRLSVMSFDPAADAMLLAAIAKEFPELEALHVVVLLTELSNVSFPVLDHCVVANNVLDGVQEHLRASGPSLLGFKSLRVLAVVLTLVA